jgi:hypothetical protein
MSNGQLPPGFILDEELEEEPLGIRPEQQNDILDIPEGFTLSDEIATPAGRIGETSALTGEPIAETEIPFEGTAASFIEGLKKDAGATVGGTIGDIMGKGPASIPLSALLGAGGDAWQQLYEQAPALANELLGTNFQINPNAPATPQEAFGRMMSKGGREGLYTGGGYGATKVAGKILSPFKNTVTEEGKIAKELFSEYMPKTWYGASIPGPLPAEMTQSRVLDIADNIASNSFAGGPKLAKHRDVVRPKAIFDMTDDLVESFGRNLEAYELGDLVTETIRVNYKNVKGYISENYYNTAADLVRPKTVKVKKRVDVPTGRKNTRGQDITQSVVREVEELQGGAWINTKEIKDFVADKLKSTEILKGFESEASGGNLAEMITRLPDKIPFREAQEMRSLLLNKFDELALTNKGAPARGMSKKLAGILHDGIAASLKKESPEAFKLWSDGNKLWKGASRRYNSRFLKGLIRQADPMLGGRPEAVLNSIFRNGGVSSVRQVKKAIGEKNFHQLKSWHIREMVEKSSLDNMLKGDALLRNIKKLGDGAYKSIYTPQERRSIERVAKALKAVQETPKSGGGGFLIQVMQGTALTTMLSGHLPAGPAATVVIGPEIVSRLMLNPVASRWLSEGLVTVPKNARHVASFAARMGQILDDDAEKYGKIISDETEEQIRRRFEASQ